MSSPNATTARGRSSAPCRSRASRGDSDHRAEVDRQDRPPSRAGAAGCLVKGGTVARFIDGRKTSEGEIGASLATVFLADDGCDVGEASGAPVSPNYPAGANRFNGTVKGVELAIVEAAENADHLVDPRDVVRLAPARR